MVRQKHQPSIKGTKQMEGGTVTRERDESTARQEDKDPEGLRQANGEREACQLKPWEKSREGKERGEGRRGGGRTGWTGERKGRGNS